MTKIANSSCIHSIEFDGGKLRVRFASNPTTLYTWHGVPPWAYGLFWANAKRLDSAGKAWHRTLKSWLSQWGIEAEKSTVLPFRGDLATKLRASLRRGAARVGGAA